MLQRILELPAESAPYDRRSLRAVASAARALPGDARDRVMDAFGDVLYNLYGSTETGFGDDRHARGPARRPRTAGRAPRGTIVRARRRGARSRAARPAGSSSAAGCCSTGYTGGGAQGASAG